MIRRDNSPPVAQAGARLALVVVLGVAAACGSGESAIESGVDRPTTTSSAVSDPTDDTDDTDDVDDTDSAPGGVTDPAPGDDDASATTAPAPTTTATPLAEFPPCPVDALDGASGPVEIEFWHTMTNELENSVVALTDAYNVGQDRVRVRLENQTGHVQAFEKFNQSGVGSRPDLVQLSEVAVQAMAESGTVIPVQACMEAAAFDSSAFVDRVLASYTFGGVLWSMPFNVSSPVLYFNKAVFEAAGLDPEASPPVTFDEIREVSQVIVDSGAAAFGLSLDTGADSGGGGYLEQWFSRAGELYVDNDNGRGAPATRVLYDGPAGVELLTTLQSLVADGLAVNVGDNVGGQDTFLKMADQQAPAAMTVGTSAALGTIMAVLDAGLIPGITADQLGVGPMPGPSGEPGALVGGASLYVVADRGDTQAAAAWDFVEYLVSAQSQSTWAAETGYVPIRTDAVDLEPVASVYVDDPRFRVSYDQLLSSPETPAALGPVFGPQREVRSVSARAVAEIYNGADVQDALTRSADLANALIADYAVRN